MRVVVAMVLLAAPVALAGCLERGPGDQGPECALFDPVPPAGQAQLDVAGRPGAPANDSFVLEIRRLGEDPFHRTVFREDGCVGFSLPGDGRYAFTAEAPDKEDPECTWYASATGTASPEQGYLEITLEPRPRCP